MKAVILAGGEGARLRPLSPSFGGLTATRYGRFL